MAPEFFQTMMGKKFYEGTMPSIARNLERLAKVNEGLLQKMEQSGPQTEDTQPGDGISQFIDPYVRLQIPDTKLTVQVKLEGEGVVVDVFEEGESNSVASVWKLYDEMATGEPADGDPE